MATSRSKEAIFSFVEDGTVQLEIEGGRNPKYDSLVVTADLLIVIDGGKVQLHSRHDGRLLASSDKLESSPMDMCLISNNEVAVIFWDSTIEIMSFESTHHIKRVKRFHVTTGFNECYSLAKVVSTDKLVVSGMKWDDDMLYWCVVNLTDGRVDSTRKICKGDLLSRTHLAIKNDTVYISCHARKPSDTGVYSYPIANPKRRKFLYRHSDLNIPRGLCVDTRDYIYVCSECTYSIHQLTERGELVTIHTLSSSPYEIFYEEQDGDLYISESCNKNITRYRLEYPYQQGVPEEILNMDERSIQLFEEALKDGRETVYHIRVMVVGHVGVGKTTLIKRLLGEEVNVLWRHSTEGIDVYMNCCDASLSTLEWTRQNKNSDQGHRLQRLVRVLNEQQSVKGKVADKDHVVIRPQGETADSNACDTDTESVMIPPQGVGALMSKQGEQSDRSPEQDHPLDHSAAGSQLKDFPSAIIQRKLTQSEINASPVLKLLHENADQLKRDTGENAKLTIWDFAGQYSFYTTHQTFLTQRAIYLLVSDVSEQLTDIVADECYFDSKGIKRCKVHEMTEVWLNSIHSCASSPKSSVPPVILVGTHVDKILQKRLSAKETNLERQSDLSTASTDAASATRSQQESFEPPKKRRRGVHTLPVDDHLKKRRKSRLQQGRKRKIIETDVIVSSSTDKPIGEIILDTDVMACPSTDKPVGEMIVHADVMARPSTEKPVRDIIVGADAGKVNRDEICKGYFREVRSYLKDKPTRFHLVDEDFAIDNTVVDKRLEDLKRKILKVAIQQPYWGEEIPARWILLEQELMNQKANGVKVISLEEVENLNKKGTVQIEKSEELDLFLRFLHETGIIIYFSIEVLRDNIVLDPIWLIDALKSLINAQPTLPESPADNSSQSTSPADNGSQSTSPADSTVTQRWSDFKEKGILHLELINAVWTQEKHPELHAHKDHILLIMEQLNIIANPRSFSEIGEKVENYSLAPCMLRQETPKEVISTRRNTQMESTPVLQCVFRGKFLPSPIFHRLLAACVAHWPIAKEKETSKNLIFCGCGVFDLDLFHRLTLYFKNHVISARITRMANDQVKIPDSKLCSNVKRFITLNLSKITSYLGQNLHYDLHVKCPPFEMWNADEGHDPDSPITPEHMNHARLCVALVSVCGKAMKDILHKNVPTTHKDIYQAILAKKTKLTCGIRDKSGKWQKAPLNQSQSQLVFPDPQQQKTGTLDQFDLSLLYILIRNVSTVSAPVTDWGNDPHDQPRDASLGASVERIRSYRNHISGHSPDGKLNRQDFEDYWNKFESVLRDIEAVIGSQGYIPKLEKQKRQVISIYEAC